MGKIYKSRLLTYGEDFDKHMIRFCMIIEHDKNFINSIEEKHKKKVLKRGLVSHAVKELIKSYIAANWKPFVAAMKKKGFNIEE